MPQVRGELLPYTVFNPQIPRKSQISVHIARKIDIAAAGVAIATAGADESGLPI